MKESIQSRLLLVVLIVAFASFAKAQEPGRLTGDSSMTIQQPESATRTSADESFDINIPQRRITRCNYQASTAVEIGSETGELMNLRVGVAVGAGCINVLLVNVTGQVRFHATLEAVLSRIRTHRAPGATR